MQDDTIHTLGARELDRVSGGFCEGGLPGPLPPELGLPSIPPPFHIPFPPGPGPLTAPMPGLKVLTF